MNGFLIWVRAFDGTLCPQLAFDAEGARPYLDAGVRSALVCWTPLKKGEARMSLAELARRYPPGLGHMMAAAGMPADTGSMGSPN